MPSTMPRCLSALIRYEIVSARREQNLRATTYTIVSYLAGIGIRSCMRGREGESQSFWRMQSAQHSRPQR